MQPAKVTPETALILPPGMALDVFVFQYVLGGLLEMESASSNSSRIPSCSRRFGDAHLILIKIMAENRGRELGVSFGDEYYDVAKAAGFISAEKVVPVWRLAIDNAFAFGRSFQEAVCKLAIKLEMARGTPA